MPIPSLPSHASPIYSPQPLPPSQVISHYNLDHEAADSPPGTLLSPAFTPPVTPGTGTPALIREAHSVPVDTSNDPRPRLLDTLPEVKCIVRARIPISNDVETFLHLYQNNTDDKEHLAIVFGPNIRSTSLDAPVPGETEMDRMIRGAYTGRLYPGRTISRIDQQPSASRRAPTSNPIPNSPLAPPSPLTSTSSHSTSTSHPTQSIAMTAPLVRIHSECYTGENVGSVRCDCGDQLEEAKRLMSLPSSSGGGVVIYLRQEGRGIGLGEKLKAYNLQDLGSDTVEANLLLRHPADARTYGLATAMLVDLGLGGERGIRLLTNNPDKVRAVEGPGREVVVRERVAMVPFSWKSGGEKGVKGSDFQKYFETKIKKMGHMPE